MSEARKLVTLGMFIIDEFAFLDTTGKPTGRTLSPQEEYTSRSCTRSPLILLSPSDWGRRHLCQHWRSHLVRFHIPPSKRGVPPVRTDGTHVRGCRVCFVSAFQLTRTRTSRLPASQVGMIVDKGGNFPQEIDATLRTYGENMWFFREQPGDTTTRALNSYIGDHRKWVPNNTTYPPRSTPGVSNRVPSAATMMRLLVPCAFFFFSSHVSQAFNTLRLEYVSLPVT